MRMCRANWCVESLGRLVVLPVRGRVEADTCGRSARPMGCQRGAGTGEGAAVLERRRGSRSTRRRRHAGLRERADRAAAPSATITEAVRSYSTTSGRGRTTLEIQSRYRLAARGWRRRMGSRGASRRATATIGATMSDSSPRRTADRPRRRSTRGCLRARGPGRDDRELDRRAARARPTAVAGPIGLGVRGPGVLRRVADPAGAQRLRDRAVEGVSRCCPPRA